MTAGCTDPTLTAPHRDAGVMAFIEGRPEEAVRLLRAVLKNDPRDRAAEAFLVSSLAKLEDARERAAEEQRAARHVVLAPVLLGPLLNRAVVGAPSAKVHLEKVSEAKNLITDVDDWYAKNGLAHSRFAGRQGETPAHVPLKLGNKSVRGIFLHADHVAAVYDGLIVVSAEGKRPLVFDAERAMRGGPKPFEVGFAQLVGDVLVVQLAYNGYAKESAGHNAYFAAYDATSGGLRWTSEPLVSNAGDAVVAGGSIVTGYGFTAEPDFLFVLDLVTGKVEQKIAVKSGPEVIQQKGDRLFVRTYDTDYVFKSTLGFAPPQAAALVDEARTPASVDAEQACWVRHATASIAARDAEGLREASLALAKRSQDQLLHAVLKGEADHLADDDRIDLTTAPLVVVPAPPWDGAGASGTAGTSPRLVKVSSTNAFSDRWHAFDPKLPFFIAPIEKGKLPDGGVGRYIASSYGQEDLRAIIPDQARGPDRTILIYGGRYVALLDGSKAERVFDLEAFRHPPKADPQMKEFAIQDATYAQERDGVLYVCNGGGSYAKEVFGKKGYLSALDAKSGTLLWRSAPLTCNATFAVVGDHLIAGYGFTNEPDNVFVIRRSDGAIVDKVPIKSAPETITVDGRRVRVQSYGVLTELELR